MITEQQEQEIERRVMEKYPKTDDEKRGCQTEIFFRTQMRKEYREKLIKELSETVLVSGEYVVTKEEAEILKKDIDKYKNQL